MQNNNFSFGAVLRSRSIQLCLKCYKFAVEDTNFCENHRHELYGLRNLGRFFTDKERYTQFSKNPPIAGATAGSKTYGIACIVLDEFRPGNYVKNRNCSLLSKRYILIGGKGGRHKKDFDIIGPQPFYQNQQMVINIERRIPIAVAIKLRDEKETKNALDALAHGVNKPVELPVPKDEITQRLCWKLCSIDVAKLMKKKIFFPYVNIPCSSKVYENIGLWIPLVRVQFGLVAGAMQGESFYITKLVPLAVYNELLHAFDTVKSQEGIWNGTDFTSASIGELNKKLYHHK